MLRKFYKKFIEDDKWVATMIIVMIIITLAVAIVGVARDFYDKGYQEGREGAYKEQTTPPVTSKYQETTPPPTTITVPQTTTTVETTTTPPPTTTTESTTTIKSQTSTPKTTQSMKVSTYNSPPEPEVVDGFINLGEFKLTAYCPCSICCGHYAYNRPLDENGKPIVYTASGALAVSGKTIAVDPSVIPYGTEVIINGNTYIAQDCGGAIKYNKIDVYFDNHEDACNFGVQYGVVYIKEEV